MGAGIAHGFIESFVHDRFSLQRFTGLPLTLLIFAFLYTVSLLLGIVGDYLFGDPLIAADLRIANLRRGLDGEPAMAYNRAAIPPNCNRATEVGYVTCNQ